MLGGFSPALAEAERHWKRFMYAALYHHPRQIAASVGAQKIVNELFLAYHANPALMSDSWVAHCDTSEPDKSRHIADFIAGMTDRYALSRHSEIYGATQLPEGFVI
jgi:dGTPase